MTGTMRNCSGCGKVFVSLNHSRICPDCRAKEEEREQEIAAYVRANPKTTITEIVAALGVQEPLIRRMIRAGRFVAIPGVDLSYPCDKCGAPIQRGQYCEKCRKEMCAKLTAVAAKKRAFPDVRTPPDAGSNRKGYVTIGNK